MNRCLTSCLLLAVFFACAFAQVPVRKPPKKVPEVNQTCMNCICQASSNCDETMKCRHKGGNSYFCGPYVISWAYWHDGGKPGETGLADDFETCLTNRTCAEEAVRGYMRRYGQDCDNNGEIDCDDFARIHKLGFTNCGNEAIKDTDYWKKYDICYYGYQPPNDYNLEAGDYDYGAAAIDARQGFPNFPESR